MIAFDMHAKGAMHHTQEFSQNGAIPQKILPSHINAPTSIRAPPPPRKQNPVTSPIQKKKKKKKNIIQKATRAFEIHVGRKDSRVVPDVGSNLGTERTKSNCRGMGGGTS